MCLRAGVLEAPAVLLKYGRQQLGGHPPRSLWKSFVETVQRLQPRETEQCCMRAALQT